MTDCGQIHFYTGNGKGKTTAAFGLSLRMAGAGKKTFIGQFVKNMKYAEVKALQSNYLIVIEQLGRTCFINQKPTKEDYDAATTGYNKILNVLQSETYDLVILDEIFIAVYYKLLSTKDIINIINQKPKHTELVLTGRYAPSELYKYADLITEMKEIKHYYTKGLESRKGIEF